MAEKLNPTQHVTIGSIIDAGLKLRAFCNRCLWAADVDLASLAERHGRDMSSLPPHIVPKLVCGQCGSKDVGVVLTGGKEVSDDTAAHIVSEWWPKKVD